jgi:hypothetical protein
MAQLNLNFIDIPLPETHLWEQLSEKQRKLVVETLARLMIKAQADSPKEQTNHD